MRPPTELWKGISLPELAFRKKEEDSEERECRNSILFRLCTMSRPCLELYQKNSLLK